jgi:hypothetical protein
MYRSRLNPLSPNWFGRGVSDRVNCCGRTADDIQLSHKQAIVTALGRATGSIPVSRTSVCAGKSLYLDSLRKAPRRYQDNWLGCPTIRSP